MSAAPFTFGADEWPGLAKLAEECGELQQVIGKLMAFPEGEHPDGAALAGRLADELADVAAASTYVRAHAEQLQPLWRRIADRIAMKFQRFERWHEEAADGS